MNEQQGVICPICQATNDSDARHCQKCGNFLPKRAIKCKLCGKENDLAAEFCKECGCNLAKVKLGITEQRMLQWHPWLKQNYAFYSAVWAQNSHWQLAHKNCLGLASATISEVNLQSFAFIIPIGGPEWCIKSVMLHDVQIGYGLAYWLDNQMILFDLRFNRLVRIFYENIQAYEWVDGWNLSLTLVNGEKIRLTINLPTYIGDKISSLLRAFTATASDVGSIAYQLSEDDKAKRREEQNLIGKNFWESVSTFMNEVFNHR